MVVVGGGMVLVCRWMGGRVLVCRWEGTMILVGCNGPNK